MPDVYDSDPTTLPPLTRAAVEGMSTGPGRVGPVASDRGLRAVLDALGDLETRVTALENP